MRRRGPAMRGALSRRDEWRDAVKRTALAAEVVLHVDRARRLPPAAESVLTDEQIAEHEGAIKRARDAGVTYTQDEIAATMGDLIERSLGPERRRAWEQATATAAETGAE